MGFEDFIKTSKFKIEHRKLRFIPFLEHYIPIQISVFQTNNINYTLLGTLLSLNQIKGGQNLASFKGYFSILIFFNHLLLKELIML